MSWLTQISLTLFSITTLIINPLQDIGELSTRDGKLLCPLTDCGSAAFSEITIAKAGQNAFRMYTESLIRLREYVISKEIGKEMEKQKKVEVDRELKRLIALTEHQRTVLHHSQQIVENILNLKCPKCQWVFVDFTGCFALTCSNASCKCHFCGWCLKDCGSDQDTHRHVATCKKNPSNCPDFYGRQEQFEDVHKASRQKQARDYLRTILDPRVQRDVYEKCEPHFRALGLHVHAVGTSNTV